MCKIACPLEGSFECTNVYMCVCVCLCICVYVCMYVDIYVYTCVCVCVCLTYSCVHVCPILYRTHDCMHAVDDDGMHATAFQLQRQDDMHNKHPPALTESLQRVEGIDVTCLFTYVGVCVANLFIYMRVHTCGGLPTNPHTHTHIQRQHRVCGAQTNTYCEAFR